MPHYQGLLASPMAGSGEVGWKVEPIPDTDSLFLRVHRANIDGAELRPRAFEPHGQGVSTNWSKYSNPKDTRDSVGPHPDTGKPRDPLNYGVAQFSVKFVRNVPKLTVKHTPLPEIRAHTDIRFALADKEEMRVKLTRVPFDWCLMPGG